MYVHTSIHSLCRSCQNNVGGHTRWDFCPVLGLRGSHPNVHNTTSFIMNDKSFVYSRYFSQNKVCLENYVVAQVFFQDCLKHPVSNVFNHDLSNLADPVLHKCTFVSSFLFRVKWNSNNVLIGLAEVLVWNQIWWPHHNFCVNLVSCRRRLNRISIDASFSLCLLFLSVSAAMWCDVMMCWWLHTKFTIILLCCEWNLRSVLSAPIRNHHQMRQTATISRKVWTFYALFSMFCSRREL